MGMFCPFDSTAEVAVFPWVSGLDEDGPYGAVGLTAWCSQSFYRVALSRLACCMCPTYFSRAPVGGKE